MTTAEERVAELEHLLDRLKLTQRNSASIYEVRGIAALVRVDVRTLQAELEKANELLGEINDLSCGVPTSALLNEINTLACRAPYLAKKGA